jgi:hypothetical protein
LGATEADLLKIYPTLRAEDLANAWAYARSHRAEILAQIEANNADLFFYFTISGLAKSVFIFAGRRQT